MDNKQFTRLFFAKGKEYSFEMRFNGLFMESPDTIFVTYLQKSNFGDYYQHIIKIYVQGMFMKSYTPNKDLVKKDVGHIRAGDPKEYQDIYFFDKQLEDIDRIQGLDQLFEKYILPFAKQVSSIEKIKNLADSGEIHLLPAVEKEINRMLNLKGNM